MHTCVVLTIKTQNVPLIPPRGNEPHLRGTPIVCGLDDFLRICTNPRPMVTANNIRKPKEIFGVQGESPGLLTM